MLNEETSYIFGPGGVGAFENSHRTLCLRTNIRGVTSHLRAAYSMKRAVFLIMDARLRLICVAQAHAC
jgi:hypothetical protein